MFTQLTDLLEIEYPIVQGGMMWVGRAELASAVSNAGGLGIITALTQPSPALLSKEVERCRTMTSKPFGVNLTMLPSANPPPYREYAQVIVDSGVKIVETAGNVPVEFFHLFKEAGIKILHKCVSVRHALSAQKKGVDAVSIDGFECAGHPGEYDVPGLILIPAAVKALDIPVVASGGFADGKGMAAALVLGAQGINMGTRFMLTQEAPINEKIKRALISGSELDTRLIFRKFKNTARVFRNAISEEVARIESLDGATFEDIHSLVSGQRGKSALESGDVDGGILWAGMCIGLIDDIPTCEALIKRIVMEVKDVVSKTKTECFLT